MDTKLTDRYKIGGSRLSRPTARRGRRDGRVRRQRAHSRPLRDSLHTVTFNQLQDVPEATIDQVITWPDMG